MGWYERLGQWSDEHRFGVDLTVTLVLAVVFVPASAAFSSGGASGVGTSAGWAAFWALLILAPLPWRRSHPLASSVTVYSVALVHLLAGYLVIFPADFAVLVALYSVTVYGPRWAHRTAIVASLVGAVVLGIALGLLSGRLADLATMVFFTSAFGGMTFLAVWAFGLVRRSRRETIAALVDRAERLEVERDQQAQIATAAERARIAREMHDIVAHSLSVIIAQADGGRYAAANDPDAATRALTTVSETGRAALADMRRLLGVLRSEPPRPATSPTAAVGPGGTLALPSGRSPGTTLRPTTAGPSPYGPAGTDARSPSGGAAAALERAPQPDTADLESLVAQVRDSGMRVSFVRVGESRPLPPGAGLTVYRVCQEALTNVLKHAGPDPEVTVVVRWGATTLDLEVEDDGRGASTAAENRQDSRPGGYGVLGMRERAALFGGTVQVGPRAGGGFRVHLRIPVPPVPPAPRSAPAPASSGDTRPAPGPGHAHPPNPWAPPAPAPSGRMGPGRAGPTGAPGTTSPPPPPPA
ncbi:sensor histidine kinase [Cellulosimicrobium protaetiae]|uniref:histidine kinase n=1 Tax=Cellulosimicrobium protaetiae TaxID=2587808 RepID=A0A6M5UC39_9MICO|nr:sensor histidine kinase [Cellulosimicrobium protaetiae]QJW36077.1 sensor histidine kinase [Cellulosimicrobium protaetiae]